MSRQSPQRGSVSPSLTFRFLAFGALVAVLVWGIARQADEPPAFTASVAERCTGDLLVQDAGDFQRLRGCEVYRGSIHIRETNIEDLSRLAGLRHVDGNLVLQNNPRLASLSGTDSIQSISGKLTLIDLPGLVDSEGFGALRTVGGMEVIGLIAARRLQIAPNLESLSGNLRIAFMPALTSLSLAPQLTEIGGDFRMNRVDLLETLDGVGKLQHVAGTLSIRSSPRLHGMTALNGLRTVGGRMELLDLPSLRGVEALGGLELVGDSLAIRGTPKLGSLAPLKKLKHQGGARITDMPDSEPTHRDALPARLRQDPNLSAPKNNRAD